MGTENSKDSKEGEKPNKEPEAPEKLLDNDTLRKLVNEEVPFESLTPEQRTEFHQRFVEGDEEGVPTVEEEAEAAKKAVATTEQGEQPTGTPAQPDPNTVTPNQEGDADKSEILAKLKAEKDANNTLRQRLQSAQEKLQSIESMKVPEPPKIEDALDENLTKQDKWNREMASKLNTYADTESANIKKEVVSTQQNLLYSDVSLLQTENPELKTSMPIENLDKAYVRFRDGLAGAGATNDQKNEAVDKFFSDAEFRKSKEAQGMVFPIKDNDWNNYKTISSLIQYKRNGGDPNWDSSKMGDKFPDMDVTYYKFKKDNGIIPDPVQKAVLDATGKVIDQVAENSTKPNLLSPEIGKASEGVDGMSEQQAEQWLIDHPTPSSPEEVAVLQSILKKFSPSSSATPAAAPAQTQGVVF